MSTASRWTGIEYPTSDGKPMAETDLHRDLMIDAIRTLKHRFRDRDNVYVSGNLLIFYEEGNRRKHVSPDTFVVFGVPNKKRDNYLTWVEGKFPQVLIEFTSKSTKREDILTKMVLYREVFKAKEYFLFDPYGDYLKPRFQGFRRVRGQWKDIPLVDGKMICETLGLELHIVENTLRFFDPQTGEYLASPEERAELAEDQAEEAFQRAEEEAKRAEEEAKRAEEEAKRANEERERAEEAAQRAAQAELARRQLAEENERLKQEIERLRRNGREDQGRG